MQSGVAHSRFGGDVSPLLYRVRRRQQVVHSALVFLAMFAQSGVAHLHLGGNVSPLLRRAWFRAQVSHRLPPDFLVILVQSVVEHVRLGVD